MDDCWMINIKAPASLNVEQGEPDEEGYQVNILQKDGYQVNIPQKEGYKVNIPQKEGY